MPVSSGAFTSAPAAISFWTSAACPYSTASANDGACGVCAATASRIANRAACTLGITVAEDDSIWYLVEAPTIADERRSPVHTNSETLRCRRPRDDERGAAVPGPHLRSRAASRRVARPRSRLRHRHDDAPAARPCAARRLHRAEPQLRGARA